MTESYHSTSPYAYVMNNPVMMTDPDGRQHLLTQAYDSSPDLNTNPQNYSHLLGGGGGTPAYEMISGGGSGGESTGDTTALLKRMNELGGYWTNQGYGFSSNEHIAIDYFGTSSEQS